MTSKERVHSAPHRKPTDRVPLRSALLKTKKIIEKRLLHRYKSAELYKALTSRHLVSCEAVYSSLVGTHEQLPIGDNQAMGFACNRSFPELRPVADAISGYEIVAAREKDVTGKNQGVGMYAINLPLNTLRQFTGQFTH